MTGKKFFFVKSLGTVRKIEHESILFIEGVRNYSKIHTIYQSLETRSSLKDLESFLPADTFIRIHKSYIIAVSRINKICKEGIYLEQQHFLPIGETYKENIVLFVANHSIDKNIRS